MKYTKSLFLLAVGFALLPGSRSLAVDVTSTSPIGYQKTTIKAGQFNLFGFNFLKPKLAEGTLEATTSTTLTDEQSTFTSSLAGQANLWVEIVDGSGTGAASRVTSFTNTALTTEEDLSAFASSGSSYVVRSAHTVAGLFGSTNNLTRGLDSGSTEIGLKPGNASSADIIWIPAAGGFIKIYYAVTAPPFTTAGWKSTIFGNADASATPIYHTEGILLERRGATSLALHCHGDVKVNPAMISVSPAFNYVNRVFPVGATLGNSGLAPTLMAGNATTADIIWLPDDLGSYDKFYYAEEAPPFTTAGWKGVSTGNADKSSTPLTSGFIIERKGAPLNVTISPDPAIYGDF